MGASASRQDMQILVLGLEGAGKTAILKGLKLGDVVSEQIQAGLNVEVLANRRFGNRLRFVSYDLPGQSGNFPDVAEHFQHSDALVFVVDCADAALLGEARRQLAKVLECHEFSGLPLLVLANKQDLPNAVRAPRVAEKLGLTRGLGRPWRIQASGGTRRDLQGALDGVMWLADTFDQRRKRSAAAAAGTPGDRSASDSASPTREPWSRPALSKARDYPMAVTAA